GRRRPSSERRRCRCWVRGSGGSDYSWRRSAGDLGGGRLGASSLSPRGAGGLRSVGAYGGASHLEYSSGIKKRGKGRPKLADSTIGRKTPFGPNHGGARAPDRFPPRHSRVR